MKIYTLSRRGEMLAHSTRNPDTAEWRIIHYLSRQHSASKEKIMADLKVPSTALANLSAKRIIVEDSGVSV